MAISDSKLRAKKPRSKAARVIAVRRLPSDGIPEAAVASSSPYVTDNGYAEFFGGLFDILSSIEKQQAASDDERKKAVHEVGKYIAAQSPRLAADDEPVIAAVALSRLAEALYNGVYKPTKLNTLYAIEAFLAFHHLGLYPPLWVLDWLNTAFLSYMKSSGEESLDNLLGTTRKRGQTKIWDEMRATSVEDRIMQEIADLNSIGISVADAAAMVTGRLDAAKMRCPTPETLAERYVKRGWSKVFKRLNSAPATISPEEKKRILAAYPKDTIPAKCR